MCEYSGLGGQEMKEQSMFTRRSTMNVDSSVPCAGILDLKQKKRAEQKHLPLFILTTDVILQSTGCSCLSNHDSLEL